MNRLYQTAVLSGGVSAAIFLIILLSLSPPVIPRPPTPIGNNTGTQSVNNSAPEQNNSFPSPGPEYFYLVHPNITKTAPAPPVVSPSATNTTTPSNPVTPPVAPQGGGSSTSGGNAIFNGGGGGGGSTSGQNFNRPPIATDMSVTTNQNVSVSITLSGRDPDGNTPSFSVSTAPLHGTLSGIAPHLTYSPSSSYVGSDHFNFVVSDGLADDTGTVTINILKVPNYKLELLVGEDPINDQVSVGQEVRAVASTDDPLVKSVIISWNTPGGQTSRQAIVNLTSGRAIDNFTLSLPGNWTVQAEFGHDHSISRELTVNFFVVPESPAGVVALTGASFAAFALFIVLRKRSGRT